MMGPPNDESMGSLTVQMLMLELEFDVHVVTRSTRIPILSNLILIQFILFQILPVRLVNIN